jgi:hypothetical protein
MSGRSPADPVSAITSEAVETSHLALLRHYARLKDLTDRLVDQQRKYEAAARAASAVHNFNALEVPR